MSACEDIVKKYLEIDGGLADIIAEGEGEQRIMGITLKMFQPVKLVVGPHHIMGIIVRMTKQTIVVLDALGHTITVKVPKITMIWRMRCEEFIRHMKLYKLDPREKEMK